MAQDAQGGQGGEEGFRGVDAATGDRAAGHAGAGGGQGAAAPGQGGAPTGGVRVGVRYFAGAAAAAGTDGEVVDLGPGATLGDLRARVLDLHPALERVLAVATTLVDEVAVADGGTRLVDGVGVDVLPPFAGG